MDYDEYLASDNGGEPEADIRDAFKQINAQSDADVDDDENEADSGSTTGGADEATTDAEKDKGANDKKAPDKQEDKPAKKPDADDKPVVHTPEENARNAERRRQHEANIAEKARRESVEFKMVETLAKMSGRTPEQLYQDVLKTQLEAEAKAKGYTPEAMLEIHNERQRSAQIAEAAQTVAAQANEEQTRREFGIWMNRIETESTKILQDHPYLTKADTDAAMNHMVNVIGNPHIPLEDAVWILHRTKILEGKQAAAQEKAENEALAKISGRKQSPLPPQGGKARDTETLSSEERIIAKKMGISEKDWIANKRK